MRPCRGADALVLLPGCIRSRLPRLRIVRAAVRDHIERRVTDLLIVGHPARLNVRPPRVIDENTGGGSRLFQQRLPLLAE